MAFVDCAEQNMHRTKNSKKRSCINQARYKKRAIRNLYTAAADEYSHII